jgi:hypothetical protein
MFHHFLSIAGIKHYYITTIIIIKKLVVLRRAKKGWLIVIVRKLNWKTITRLSVIRKFNFKTIREINCRITVIYIAINQISRALDVKDKNLFQQ